MHLSFFFFVTAHNNHNTTISKDNNSNHQNLAGEHKLHKQLLQQQSLMIKSIAKFM